MNLILLGPPGAGKGTLASQLKDQFHLLHISTGDLLREEMKSGTDLGKKIQKAVESGELVSDDIVIAMIEKKLSQRPSSSMGYMLDGFPRTTIQAENLDKILDKIKQPVTMALNMDATLPVILQRLTGRRVCKQCGATYHVENRPSKKHGICDKCGGELYQRADDTKETIQNRLHVYHEKTAPIISYYEKQGKLARVNGDLNTEELFKTIVTKLNDQQPNKNKVAPRH